MVEHRHNSAASGGVGIEEQVEVAIAVNIHIGNVSVICEVAREQAGEDLTREHALAVVQEEHGFGALEIHAEDVGDTIVIEICHQGRTDAIEPGARGDVAEVEGPYPTHEHDIAGRVGGEQVFASIVIEVLDGNDVMLRQR